MPRTSAALVASLVLHGALTPLAAQELPAPARYAVTDVTVVDVAGSALLAAQTVLVDGERIADVGDSAAVGVPDGYVRIDGKGLYLMPGLFDAHVHLADPDTFAPLLVANGVVFARDMGSDTQTGLRFKRELQDGERLGPELIVCGAILDGRPPVWPFSEAVETADEARAAVERLADAGVDQIKLYSLLRPEVYAAAVATAKARRLLPVGHIPVEVGLDAALAAGQVTSEHLTGFEVALAQLAGVNVKLDRRQAFGLTRLWAEYAKLERAQIQTLCKKVADGGMALCPTLIVIDRVGQMQEPATKEDPRLQYVSPSMRAFWDSGRYSPGMAQAMRTALPYQQKLLKDLFDAGVTLLCGTDLANPYVIAGFAVHDEMVLLQAAGLPASEVLKAAVTNPARVFGVADRLGAVATGKTASLLLVGADPLRDVKHARDIRGVFLRGRWFDRRALDGVLAEVRAKAAPVAAQAGAAGSGDKSTEAPLALPGEVVARGRFDSSFNGQPSEREEFLITKDDDGYHVASRSTPLSSFGQPVRSEVHYGVDLALRSARYESGAGKRVVRAEYALRDGKVVGTAKSGDKALPESALTLPPDSVVAGPGSAYEFVNYARVALAVGEEKTFTSAGFGYPDWKPATTAVRLKRLPDTTVEFAGKQVAARHFEVSFKLAMGEFRGETWLDAQNLLLRSRLKMPFGTIDTVRAAE